MNADFNSEYYNAIADTIEERNFSEPGHAEQIGETTGLARNITGSFYTFNAHNPIFSRSGKLLIEKPNTKLGVDAMKIQLTNLITTCLIESNRNNREEVKKCIKDKYENNNGLHSLPSESYTSVMDTLQKEFKMNDREMASLYRIFANKHTLFYTRETLEKKADSYYKPWRTSRSGGTRRARRTKRTKRAKRN